MNLNGIGSKKAVGRKNLIEMLLGQPFVQEIVFSNADKIGKDPGKIALVNPVKAGDFDETVIHEAALLEAMVEAASFKGRGVRSMKIVEKCDCFFRMNRL